MLHYIVFHPHTIALVKSTPHPILAKSTPHPILVKSTPHPILEYPLSTLFS